MKNIINVEDARRIAYKKLPKFVFDFVDGGADDEITLRDNQRAFNEIKFNPRILIDVSRCDISTTVFGDYIELPVLLAPAGCSRLLCRDGELAAARAAGHEGTIFALSTASNYTIEEVAAVATNPLWFQLYPADNQEDNNKLLERAQQAGYKALCFCVDTAVPGKRERDLRNKAVVPPQVSWNKVLQVVRRPLWLRRYLFGPPLALGNLEGLDSFRGMSHKAVFNTLKEKGPANADLTWDYLAWLRDHWKGPLVIKGITNEEDARRALDYGVNGIVVSNHGGRQLDGQPPSIEVLPEIVVAVAGRAEVFIDSGIRRGADVVKSIALGAKACLIGRPYLFGMAIGGEAGIIRILQILSDEIHRTMALLGCRTLDDLGPTCLRPR